MSEVNVFHIPAAEQSAGDATIHTPEAWRVEEIDADDDGGIAMAIFTGAFAEERAYGYAEQLRGRQHRD
jgi:hypothetical protein